MLTTVQCTCIACIVPVSNGRPHSTVLVVTYLVTGAALTTAPLRQQSVMRQTEGDWQALRTHWVVSVLDTAAKKSIAQYPIQPNASKYCPIPQCQYCSNPTPSHLAPSFRVTPIKFMEKLYTGWPKNWMCLSVDNLAMVSRRKACDMSKVLECSTQNSLGGIGIGYRSPEKYCPVLNTTQYWQILGNASIVLILMPIYSHFIGMQVWVSLRLGYLLLSRSIAHANKVPTGPSKS